MSSRPTPRAWAKHLMDEFVIALEGHAEAENYYGMNGLDETVMFITNDFLRDYWTEQHVDDLLVNLPGEATYDVSFILREYVVVFSILTKMHKADYISHFAEKQFKDSSLPLKRDNMPKSWKDQLYMRDLWNDFINEQWMFCPYNFDRLANAELSESLIFPIQSKEPLQGKAVESDLAILYKVKIHPSFRGGLSEYVVFKEYRSGDSIAPATYDKEIAIYKTLRPDSTAVRNIITYYGSFKILAKGKHIIMLEYADGGDLFTWFKEAKPPSQLEHLITFWTNFFDLLLGLEAINNLVSRIPGRESWYLEGMHQDIRPQNILLIRKPSSSHPYDVTFKLVDFGTGYIKKQSMDQLRGTHRDNLGNATYASPESLHERLQPESDVWALGALASETLVWCLKGADGVENYRKLRVAQTAQDLPETHRGCFHDGIHRLSIIDDHHREVLKARLEEDRISPLVSQMILEHMLVEHPSQATQSKKFRRQAGETNIIWTRKLSLMFMSAAGDPATTDMRGGLQHTVTEPIPPAATTGNYTQPSEFDNEEPTHLSRNFSMPSGRPEVPFDSLYDSHGLHPVNRGPIQHYARRNFNLHNENSLEGSTARILGPANDRKSIIERLMGSMNGKPEGTNTQRDDDLITIERLYDKFIAPKNAKGKFGTMFSKTLKGDQFDPLKARPDLGIAVSRLKHSIGNGREQVFLIDDSKSMRRSKSSIAKTVRVLAYLIKKGDVDPNRSIELRFATLPGQPKESPNSKPLEDAINDWQFDDQVCEMGRALESLLLSILPKRFIPEPKPVSVYVLTNALWSDENPTSLCGVDVAIEKALRQLDNSNAQLNTKWLGIQFIGFFNRRSEAESTMGRRRLQFLDDKLGDLFKQLDLGFSRNDIVDTREWDDDVKDILLGAVFDVVDREVYGFSRPMREIGSPQRRFRNSQGSREHQRSLPSPEFSGGSSDLPVITNAPDDEDGSCHKSEASHQLITPISNMGSNTFGLNSSEHQGDLIKFSVGPSPSEFESLPGSLLDPSTILQDALSTGNKDELGHLLETHFSALINGQYHWIQELKDIGCTFDDIADIMLEQSRDAPWIIFEPQSVEATDITVGKHIANCVHHILDTPRAKASQEMVENDQSQFQRLVQELCGLAGVSPFTQDRNKWSGTVEFEEKETAIVSYSFPKTPAGLVDRQSSLVSRLIQIVEKLTIALGHVQMAGLCCDSFTILAQTGNDNEAIVMRRLHFALVIDLLKSLQDLNTWNSPDLQGEKARRRAAALSKILGPLFHDAPSTDPNEEPWAATDLHSALHYCSLASQLLCLGFLSYSQAHVGPLQPFFLETPLHQVTLLGAGVDSFIQDLMIEARLVSLSCIGNMLQSSVLVFKCIQPDIDFVRNQQSNSLDLSANAEDMVDTWGPGQLIIEKDGSQALGVILGGGVIHATAADQNAQFHWSPTAIEQCTYPKSFDPSIRILVGAAVNVNTNCVRNENEWWEKSRRSLQTLGTCRPHWAAEERQFGVQGGNFGLVQANVAWRKFQGCTLKKYKLDQADEHLVAFLEDPWGVQVSFCTGVSRRVALREMVADLLPVFAISGLDKRDREIWIELETAHQVFDHIKKDAESVRQWLHTLPDEHVKYMLRLIRQILQTLRDTGIDRENKHFTVAWPNKSDLQKCFKIPCREESAWLGFLADSEHCATFAYMTTKCLETDCIKCTGSNTCWGNAVPLLETAVFHVPTSEASVALALKHNDVYFVEKMDGLIYVKAQKPVVLTEVVQLLAWRSISPQGIQARVASMLRVRNDRQRRELRERTALKVIWAEEVAVCTRYRLAKVDTLYVSRYPKEVQ